MLSDNNHIRNRGMLNNYVYNYNNHEFQYWTL